MAAVASRLARHATSRELSGRHPANGVRKLAIKARESCGATAEGASKLLRPSLWCLRASEELARHTALSPGSPTLTIASAQKGVRVLTREQDHTREHICGTRHLQGLRGGYDLPEICQMWEEARHDTLSDHKNMRAGQKASGTFHDLWQDLRGNRANPFIHSTHWHKKDPAEQVCPTESQREIAAW